jgi:membrane-associated phospholipid phosphatase
MQILLAMPVGVVNTASEILAGVIVFFASYFPLFVAGASVVFLCVRTIPATTIAAPFRVLARRVRDVGYVAVVTGVTHELSLVLKNIYGIERPMAFTFNLVALIEKTDFGFPSGHAAVFSSLAVALWFIDRRAGYVAGVCALIIGAGRIFAGVHTPLDVLGGYILGSVTAVLLWVLLERIDPHTR